MLWGIPIKRLPFKLIIESPFEMWRAFDFWVKEPETLEWIKTFQSNSVFWDIGANIGVYSLYSKRKNPNIEVVAFEPEKINYDCLVSNININGFDIKHFQYAIGSKTGIEKFYVPIKHDLGSSGSQIISPISENGKEFKIKNVYDISVYTIDDLIGILNVPNYIKIDVDGREFSILQGAQKYLTRTEVRSILIEINNNGDQIDSYMTKFGFSSKKDFNTKPRKNKIYIKN